MALRIACEDASVEIDLEAGGRIEAIFYCPDTAESDSPYRKPNPGMFVEIGERLATPLEATQPSDVAIGPGELDHDGPESR